MRRFFCRKYTDRKGSAQQKNGQRFVEAIVPGDGAMIKMNQNQLNSRIPGPVLALLGALVFLQPVYSQEYNRVEEPNMSQQQVIDSIFTEMAKATKEIESIHESLAEQKLIDSESKTVVPYQSMVLENQGGMDRQLLTESAVIQWNGAQIQNVTFHQRKSTLGTGNMLKRQLTYNAQPPEDQTDSAVSPLDIVISEFVSTTEGDHMNFRYPATTGEVKDHYEKIDVRGIEKKVMIVYVRDVQSRVDILRENLRLMKTLSRRLKWMLRYEAEKRKDKVRRFIEF